MMEKKVVNMSNWELYFYNGKYNLEGLGDKHPKLGNNVYITYTTPVEKYELEQDVLTYETKNTIYVCPLKYMTTHPYGNVVEFYKEELMHFADDSEDCLDRIIAASAYMAMKKTEENPFAQYIENLQKAGRAELIEKENMEKERLCEIVKQYENSVYMEVSSISSGNILAYHIGDCIGVIKPSVHVGMFQDSILYLKYGNEEENDCRLDFRYFPEWQGLRTYSWSDNIEQAVMKNNKGRAIWFNDDFIEPSETKVFTPDTHKQGLISPDCYNGKSIFKLDEE